MVKTRKTVQLLFIAFFITLFLISRFPYETWIEGDLGLRFSPLLPIFSIIESFSFKYDYWPAWLILIATPFLGRFFCGWICPFGTLLDVANRVFYLSHKKQDDRFPNLRYLKYAILIISIFSAFFAFNLWGYFDPLSLFNRSLSIFIYPFFTLVVEKSLLALSEFSFLETPAYWLYDQFKEMIMPENQAYYQGIFWISVVILAIIGLEKISRRFWCRYLCPAGALLGLLSRRRFMERKVDEACPDCNQCQIHCKMGAIAENDVYQSDKTECIQCLNCSQYCPPKISAISYEWVKKPRLSTVNLERRQFLSSSVLSVATIGVLQLGLKNRAEEKRQIRPPGILSEADFREKCIRCMACIRICESNGGCLQPDHIRNHPLDLWLPVAVMREGYCEYNCNLCSEVCPTDAIPLIPLKEKQKYKMGLAYFVKDLCIPFVQNEDCIVCEEHCPMPDKAIKFEEKDVLLPNGTIKMLKYPYVVQDLCTGCGICENKCPIQNEAGIVVYKYTLNNGNEY